MDLFWDFATGNAVPKGTQPSVKLIDGAVIDQVNLPIDYYVEPNLDLEVAIPLGISKAIYSVRLQTDSLLVYPQKVNLYQVGDNYMGASFGDFLDAIDGSYCTYAGGDSPI